MTDPIISQQVLQFIADQIDSVPQLECLLLLHQYDARSWMREEVAARIYISSASAQGILETLLRRGLVSAEGTPVRYRYRSSEIATHALVAEVARTYQRHLVPIATFIHSKGSVSVREFARAFDLKKDR
jgi:DNA-binding IclR family transcriptional regulator